MSEFLDAAEAAYWRSQWDLAPGVTYLNHGSFGPPPASAGCPPRWQEQMDAQPMDFFFRRLEPAWFLSPATVGRSDRCGRTEPGLCGERDGGDERAGAQPATGAG